MHDITTLIAKCKNTFDASYRSVHRQVCMCMKGGEKSEKWE